VVRSYLIDQSSGRLTFSGSSVNISPELFTWGAMHPDGSFLYFLSTHDSADVEGCSDPITRHPTGIYSYYINRETGEMLYTGIDYGGASGRSSIQVDNSGGFLYHQTPRFVNVHNIDPATGELEPIGSPLHGATEYDFPGTAYSFPLNLISY
jgi:6-phosphogluconolactonase (cycloisomerase 2 family)